MVTSAVKRGSSEIAVLAILADEKLHGYEISRRIAEQSEGALHFSLASLYPLLYSLEKRGLVKGLWETAPSGRRRRCYSLTSAGKKQLQPLRKEWAQFFLALNRVARVSHG